MRVNVPALDGVFDLGLSAVLDAFQTSNELIEMSGACGPSLRGAHRRSIIGDHNVVAGAALPEAVSKCGAG
jgi:hypothetical protein